MGATIDYSSGVGWMIDNSQAKQSKDIADFLRNHQDVMTVLTARLMELENAGNGHELLFFARFLQITAEQIYKSEFVLAALEAEKIN